MRVTAKLCGLSTIDAVDAAIAGGASHIGFVFFAKSPRNVSVEQAAALAQRIAGRCAVVALLVDPTVDLAASICSVVPIDVIQLHGHETPAHTAVIAAQTGVQVWKALPVRTSADLALAKDYRGAATRILYDAKPPEGIDVPGGNGMRFDWRLLTGHAHPLPWVLSGGLDAANVAEAVRVTGADIVDVSSGIESATGIKSVDKITGFLKAVSQL